MKYFEKYDLFYDDDFDFYYQPKIHKSELPPLIRINWYKAPSGYLYYKRWNPALNRYESLYHHRLVCELTHENPENKPTVEHKNHVKTDDRPENLCWFTRVEQVAFRCKRPTTPEQRAMRTEYCKQYRHRMKQKRAA